jgi:GGDEF domain-containing protein
LVSLVQRRTRNFSEAIDSVLGALGDAIPGVVVLGQLEPDERVHRVIETRGNGVGGLQRGAVLPLAGEGIDADFLRSLGAQAWLGAPLEMSDGRIVGMLFAADAGGDAYGAEHAALLGVASRLLSHEWENVGLRSELRRLRGRANAGPDTDADTGLPNREGFLKLLDHEWRLAERGTVQSVLVACRVGSGGSGDGNGAVSPKSRLALKLAAEVLAGSTRITDRVGRIGETTICAILVGCELRDAPTFVARYLGALGRATDGRRPEIEVSCGVQPLAGDSAEKVLALAEDAAEEPGRGGTAGLTLQEAGE